MADEKTEEGMPSDQEVKTYGLGIHPDLARHFTDFEDIIDSLRLSWLGIDIDYSTEPPKKIDSGVKTMNATGVAKLTSLLKSICHKGIPMSNYDKERPYIFSSILGYAVAEEVFCNMDEYGITSIEDAQNIIMPIIFAFFSMTMRPVGEGERKFISRFTKEQTVHGGEKKRGFSLT